MPAAGRGGEWQKFLTLSSSFWIRARTLASEQDFVRDILPDKRSFSRENRLTKRREHAGEFARTELVWAILRLSE